MDKYAGIYVSPEGSHVCVVDGQGKIFKEAEVAREPEALITWFAGTARRWPGLGSRRGRCHNGSTPT